MTPNIIQGAIADLATTLLKARLRRSHVVDLTGSVPLLVTRKELAERLRRDGLPIVAQEAAHRHVRPGEILCLRLVQVIGGTKDFVRLFAVRLPHARRAA